MTDAELEALQDAIAEAQGKLNAAETAIDALPAGDAKDALNGELETEQGKLDDVKDNVPTSDQAALDAAQAALDAAKDAVAEAEEALAKPMPTKMAY
ncbi:hypothetical protein [Acinetobacter indicus]|uniref:hypothetical protein n=1 Tax=Acinetobacter indicus TaxID=756892 RepID=UPI001A9085C2|nr:hypothetical protein [Acinetobacter indicus]QSQ95956.1 hypothetical protein J0W33_13850 [Acinetobacter indicus]